MRPTLILAPVEIPANLLVIRSGIGQSNYPDATSILMLMDGGGSNSSRHYIFKQDLQVLADKLGIKIRVAHYPPYTSKWNPIEHRIFPHITRYEVLPHNANLTVLPSSRNKSKNIIF